MRNLLAWEALLQCPRLASVVAVPGGFQRPETLPPPPALVERMLDEALVCICRGVTKGVIKQAIHEGKRNVAAIGESTAAGQGCGNCQATLGEMIAQAGRKSAAPNKIELMKKAQDGLDSLPDIERFAATGNWQEMSEDDKQRFKWHGLFFRKQTPGHFMLRLRMTSGFTNARQFRVLADLSDEYGKGFCDLTTRQQIQLRWFTLADVPDIWRRLDEVGLHSKQTGMDNVRGVCGCPVAGLTPHELLDASARGPGVHRQLFSDNKEFTNLPRKFNVTITGCLENCCHAETQDIALVPAYRELDGARCNGFNVLVGGKQGSGGYTPRQAARTCSCAPEDAAGLCMADRRASSATTVRARTVRKARLAFLIEDRGVGWFRAELERRWGQPLLQAGTDMRKKHHVDHLGIHPQKPPGTEEGPPLFYAGLLVPVGRITTAQMRGVADLAERYGNGDMRLTVQQNVDHPQHPGGPARRLHARSRC